MPSKQAKKKRGQDYDWSAWQGTDTLRWTQIPDDWLDTLIPQIGEAEVRVLLCIGRHTYGWKKEWDQISLSQIVQYTGLSRTAVNRAAKLLEEKSIIQVKRDTTADGGAAPNTYRPVEKIKQGGSASSVLGGSASSVLTRDSRTRDNNENERPSVSSSVNQDGKTALIQEVAAELAPGEQPQAIATYLGRFPAALIKQAAEITREHSNTKKPIAYLYGVVQRLAEQEAVKPLAQQQADLLPELSEEEYQASLQALDRVKQQVNEG